MSQQSAKVNFDLLNVQQFLSLVGIDSFNKAVALKHYRNKPAQSFEAWYASFEKDGITLPTNDKGEVIKKDRSHFVGNGEPIVEEKPEEGKEEEDEEKEK